MPQTTSSPPDNRRTETPTGGEVVAIRAEVAPTREVPTAAELFDLLWGTLADVVGSATTATLLRRSKNALARRNHGVDELQISREGLEYRYRIPGAWKQHTDETLAVMRSLAAELTPILMELTGDVILRRLDGIAAFRAGGVLFSRAAIK
jgi:hypothetical protein